MQIKFPRLSLNRREVFVIGLGLVVGLLIAKLATQWMFFDDAYIHIRIARNFLEHGQPYFNLGDHFKADSSTGYVLLLSMALAWFSPEVAIRVVEGGAIVFTSIALTLLVYKNAGSRVMSVITVLAMLPAFLLAASGGMETSIACCLLSWAILFWCEQKYQYMVALISVAAGFRIELVLLLLLVIVYVVRSENQRLRIILWASPFAIICLLDVMWFGSIFPHAAKAKSIGYGFPLQKSIQNAAGILRWKFLALVLVFASLASVFHLLKSRLRPSLSDALLIYAGFLFAAWALSRSIIFEWYLCLLSFPIGLLLLASKQRNALMQRVACYVVIFGSCIYAWGLLVYFGPANREGHVNMRVPYYIKVASGLSEVCPTCTLATTEIGGIGYGFKGPVFDAFGLADPEAIRYHPLKVPEERADYGIGAIPPAYVEFRRPDFVVTLDVYSQALQSSEVVKSYNKYDCPFPPDLLIYSKKSGVKVFSRKYIPLDVLEKTGCHSVKS